MTFSFEILRDEATPKLSVARSIVGPPFGAAVKLWLERVRTKAATKAPRDLGKLSGDLKVTTSGDVNGIPASGAVVSEAEHAMFVHGRFTIPSQPRRRTRPHMPPSNESINGWADRHGINPWALRVSIARRGTPIIPFLSEAVDESLPDLQREVDAAQAEIVRRFNG